MNIIQDCGSSGASTSRRGGGSSGVNPPRSRHARSLTLACAIRTNTARAAAPVISACASRALLCARRTTRDRTTSCGDPRPRRLGVGACPSGVRRAWWPSSRATRAYGTACSVAFAAATITPCSVKGIRSLGDCRGEFCFLVREYV